MDTDKIANALCAAVIDWTKAIKTNQNTFQIHYQLTTLIDNLDPQSKFQIIKALNDITGTLNKGKSGPGLSPHKSPSPMALSPNNVMGGTRMMHRGSARSMIASFHRQTGKEYTQLCKFYSEGKCAKEHDCTFIHDSRFIKKHDGESPPTDAEIPIEEDEDSYFASPPSPAKVPTGSYTVQFRNLEGSQGPFTIL